MGLQYLRQMGLASEAVKDGVEAGIQGVDNVPGISLQHWGRRHD